MGWYVRATECCETLDRRQVVTAIENRLKNVATSCGFFGATIKLFKSREMALLEAELRRVMVTAGFGDVVNSAPVKLSGKVCAD